jgi:hypothetical protein
MREPSLISSCFIVKARTRNTHPGLSARPHGKACKSVGVKRVGRPNVLEQGPDFLELKITVLQRLYWRHTCQAGTRC